MRSFRPFTWVILAINIIFLIWIITGVSAASSSSTCTPGVDPSVCTAGTQIGTGIGAALIIGLWVAVDVILGILWLITRPKRRDCSVCGYSAKKGVTTCQNCGTSFAAAHPAQL